MTHLPHPPRPSGSKLLLAIRFRKDPFSVFSEMRRRHGDIFTLPLPGIGEWVCVCCPQLADDLYRVPDDAASAADFSSTFLTPVIGESSFVAADGKEHRVRRGALTTFFNGKSTLEAIPTIREVIDRQIERWPVGEDFPLLPHSMRLSLETNYRIITGISDSAQVDELVTLTKRFFDASMKSPLFTMPFLQWDLGRFSPWGRILWLKRRLRKILREQVPRLMADEGEEARTALDALYGFEMPDGSRLTLETIIDDLLIILNAGQETSSRILTWTVAEILGNPEVYEKLRDEVESVLGGEPIRAEHLDELSYLDGVIQEGIRYRPFSPFISGRVVRKSFRLGEYSMPVGATVIHAHAEVCMRHDLFPNPGKFDPEANFCNRDFARGDWAPFGGGHRLCLGRGLALVHLKVVLATIIQKLKLELCHREIKAVPAGFLFVPEDGLPVRIKSHR